MVEEHPNLEEILPKKEELPCELALECETYEFPECKACKRRGEIEEEVKEFYLIKDYYK